MTQPHSIYASTSFDKTSPRLLRLTPQTPKENSVMKQTTNRCELRYGLMLIAITLLAASSLFAQAQTQAPAPARSRADETLDRWNDIGNKLVAMAQDFPEDKYDYKLQKDQ